MAHLPPKIPNDHTITRSDVSQQKIPSIASFSPDNETTNNNQNPSWVDEFLDFSAARRSTHRRSISDSIAFLEAPMLDQCHGRSAIGQGPGNDNEFERYNDEQFMSMFINDKMHGGAMGGQNASSSNPSSPSDHNSINGEKESQNDKDHLDHSHQEKQQQQLKNEPDEDESACHQEEQTVFNNNSATTFSDRVTDPKRVKRILANRQSAQRSRVRKLQYISELERSVTSLQAEVSLLSPRVAFFDHQRLLLNVDNSALKQRIAALAQDKIFKDAHQEALKTEIERLRKIFHQQNIKKMESTKQSSPLPSPTVPSHEAKAEMEQLLNA